MLRALLTAPATMAKNAGLYITVLGIGLVQGLILVLLPDTPSFASAFTGLSVDAVLSNLAPLGMSLVTLVVQFTLSLFVFAHVARVLLRPSLAAPPSLLRESLALAILTLVVGGGALLFGTFLFGLFSGATGIASMLAGILFLGFILAFFGGIMVFGFTPANVGKGYSVREALAHSWTLATAHGLSTFLLFLALLFITGLFDTVLAMITTTLSNEGVVLGITIVGTSLLTFYSACVLANALPATEAASGASPRHLRKNR